ncbi:MAG: S9 family peptidase, partial [Candidatus Eremiobacteraeota bacterium]|nr:S9 family peptidase [Candidatus Eremiobacteraeota bacterium]
MPTTSADPLEFLEDGTDPRTVAWTGEQNARTRAALDAVPGRDALRARLSVLLGGGTIGCPESAGGRAFYVARRPGRQQAALFVREGDADRMLFDPLTLDPSGLTAIDWFYPSPNGALVVFGLSTNGDERSTLYLLDVMRGQTFGETIPDTRHCAVAWLPDEHAFYYTRFPSGSDYDQRIYLHTLGTPYSNDLLVFGEGREKEEYMAPRLSSNGRWLLVSVFRGWISNDVYLADLHGVDSYFVTVIESPDALYDAVAGDDRLFVRTNEGAPNFRVFEADPLEPRRSSWNELVAERRDAKIEAFALARGVLVFEYLRNVLSEIWWRPFDGELRRFEHPSLGPGVAAL